MKPLCSFALLAAMAFFSTSASAAVHTIQNKHLRVQYDDSSSSFSVEHLAGGGTFVPRAVLSDRNGQVAVAKVEDKTFGVGDRMSVVYADRDEDHLTLYKDIPFLFIRSRFFNKNSMDKSVTTVESASFELDLDEHIHKLVTLGTGGLAGLAEPLIGEAGPARFAAPGSGSYMFFAVAEPVTRRGVVSAWLTSDRGSGIMFPELEGKRAQVRAELQYGRLLVPPKQSADGEILVVGYFDDARFGLERYADLVAQCYEIDLPRQISGYCTWYSRPHGGASDEKHIAELSKFVAKELKPYGFDFVQIDDRWQAGQRQGSHEKFSAQYLGGPEGWEGGGRPWCNGPNSDFTTQNPDGPYPNGMKCTAELMDFLGLRPGIWILPFAWNPLTDPLIDKHEWFAKQPNGNLYYCRWAGWPLDMSHPEARSFLSGAIDRIVDEWGYKYLKLDGLWTGTASEILYINNEYEEDDLGTAIVHDPYMTPIEIYRKGMETVREAAGDDVFILGCNVSQNMRTMGASFGLVDAMRVGPDNGSSWDKLIRGPQQGTNRYFFNKRVWYNDPDPVYVRESMPIEHAQLICSWAAITGQLTVVSEWLPDLPDDRLDMIKRSMPAHNAIARPLDIFESPLASIWTLTDNSSSARRDVLGLFNWNTKNGSGGGFFGSGGNINDLHVTRSAKDLGLPKADKYVGFDFWANEFIGPFSGTPSFDVPAATCRVISLRPVTDHPQVVSTNRHITQGVIDLLEEKWDPSTNTLSGTSKVVANDPYELRIAAGKRTAVSARVSNEDQSEGVTIKITEQNDWNMRAIIEAHATHDVNWQIQFSS